MIYKLLFFVQCLFSLCLCQLNIEDKEKLLNGFVVYYNNLPNQIYTCDEGVLISAQKTDENTYKIDVNLKVSEISNLDVTRLLVCTATVQDLHENGVTVLDNDLKCEEQQKTDEGITIIDQPTGSQVEITETPVERRPIQLDNEIQANTAVTSGEQFIAIPRERQSTPCVGCSTHVNPQAAGVSDLVNLGIRHLDKHEPAVRHNIDSVVDVERQVQVVNGVRYILTLIVKFNSCTETETEACATTKACKISVLVKPWLMLPNGSKYRSILANNCTEEWQYGDEGEVVTDGDDNRAHNQIDGHHKDDSDEIRVIHNTDTQSQPNQEQTLTDEQVKDIEAQIIPNDGHVSTNTDRELTVLPDDVSKQHVVKDESVNHHGDNSIPYSETEKLTTRSDHSSSLNQEKKKAIDDLLDFLKFSGFKPNHENEEEKSRMKRSYDYDLQVLALAEDYQDLKKRLENAKFIYTLAQTMVDYLNEMDMIVKNRILKDVLKAEEEFENYQHFVYIQVLVTIPCDRAECNSEDTTKICNGVIESTHVSNPQVLNSFCHNNQVQKVNSGKEVPTDDHVLQELVKSAVKKIETESFSEHAIRLNKILSANTRQASGTLTKISIMIEHINCNKSVPYVLKNNCTVLNQLGKKICEVIVFERHWLKEKRITYTCTEIPIDVSMSDEKIFDKNKTVDDPKIQEMLSDALQHLEIQSNRNNKMKIVKVNSIASQIVGGFLTEIEFLVGYTTCKNDYVSDQPSVCELLPNEDLRTCKAQYWDRSWIEDGRQMEVSCDETRNIINDNSIKNVDDLTSNNINTEPTEKDRKKRSLFFVGGPSEQNVNDPQYKALALESLQKFMTMASSRQHYVVTNIEKVTIQVVAGKLTKILFKISPTNCLTSSDGSPVSSNCEVINPRIEYDCTSNILEQVWLDNKHISVTCQIDERRIKRNALLGGAVEQNSSDPKYLNLAKESLTKYLTESGSTAHHKVVNVTKVSTQVVSGLKTIIDFVVSPLETDESFTCQSTIWEQPWNKRKEIDVKCNINVVESRVKRSVLRGAVGNRKLEDPSDSKFKSFAEESLLKYELMMDNDIKHIVVGVQHVESQLVSGIIYIIDFTAKPTTCSAHLSQINCSDEYVVYCQSKILWQPWLNNKKIDVSCYNEDGSDERNKDRDLDIERSGIPKTHVGGVQSKDVNDPVYQKLAKETLNKYLTTSNRKYVHKVLQVHRVTEQVVEGTLTKIYYSVSPTTCLREVTAVDENDCELKIPQIVLHCTAEVWDRPWLNDKNIKVGCKKHNSSKRKKLPAPINKVRRKRQVSNDDDYVDDEMSFYYANRALQQINVNNRGGHLHKLITIHAVQHSVQMKTSLVRMYIEVAETFCLRHQDEIVLADCEEMDGQNHKLCLARLWPSPDDELVVRHVSVICDDENDFDTLSGLRIADLLVMSIREYEKKPEVKFKTVHQGEPHVIPSLDSKVPIVIKFLLATTNCTKNVNLTNSMFPCFIDESLSSKSCSSYVWMMPNGKAVSTLTVSCNTPTLRGKRSVSDVTNTTTNDEQIQKLVAAALEKLEMQSIHRYKQRLLEINSHSTKITSGKVTTIDFDVGYTSCLKYEWVDNVTSCNFLEHLPRRHCVAQFWERLWINNGRNIDVKCEDDETPLETHIEFESAEMAMELAKAALKHIEAKYPHPRKQKIVRIFSLEKQVVAGIHYRMKIEVGLTDCVALSDKENCNFVESLGLNKFCRVNVWLRPWTDHPPNYRVSCDYQDGATTELYRNIQAEHLFFDFVATYNPDYANDHNEMRKRFNIFKENVRKIHELNIYEKGTAKYGVTRFADLTYEEFQAKYTGLKPNMRNPNLLPMSHAYIPDIKVPENFDWRQYDMVTEVKDQGSCGSCWAFSVTGNIEGQWKMQSGKLVSLSEQELVDCDNLDNGCNGGLPDNAYRAIEALGGLESESDYPYEGEGDKCAFNRTLSKVQISGAVNISSNETEMAAWLLHNGPISIGINANAMQFYMGGISHPWKMLCNPTNLDHGVLIVGYGVKDYPLFNKRLPFWIVKNSWGKSWGEQGYYRVFRGDGTCGVNQMASSAVI